MNKPISIQTEELKKNIIEIKHSNCPWTRVTPRTVSNMSNITRFYFSFETGFHIGLGSIRLVWLASKP